MENKNLLVVLSIIFNLVLTNVVFAEDFTFNVPVNFSRLMDDVSKVTVACKVGANANSLGPASSVILNVPDNGELNTTAAIKLDAPQGQNPANMNNYQCSFYLQKTGSSSFTEPLSGSGLSNLGTCTNPNSKWKCSSSSGNFVKTVSGSIP